MTLGPLGASDRGEAQADTRFSIVRDAVFAYRNPSGFKAAWFAFRVTIVDPCATATLSWTPVAIPDISIELYADAKTFTLDTSTLTSILSISTSDANFCGKYKFAPTANA